MLSFGDPEKDSKYNLTRMLLASSAKGAKEILGGPLLNKPVPELYIEPTTGNI